MRTQSTNGKRALWGILGLVLVTTLSASGAGAIDITVAGPWSLTIDADDLIGGAGSELNSTYESTANQTLIAISNTAGNDDNWRVDVRRADTTWHNDFTLSVKRTGDGSGGGSVSGGSAYQAVGTTDSAFFSGSGDRSDVPIQLKLSGVSLQIPPDTYLTAITYRVVDT